MYSILYEFNNLSQYKEQKTTTPVYQLLQIKIYRSWILVILVTFPLVPPMGQICYCKVKYFKLNT